MNDNNFAGSICVTVRYDKHLQEITGEHQHPVVISEGSVFIFLLHCIFAEYPEIEERYAPGMLGFTVNGIAPKVYSPLFDGDEVYLAAAM